MGTDLEASRPRPEISPLRYAPVEMTRGALCFGRDDKERLRNRQLLNFKFLRQHPIIFQHFDKERFFVADFYCAEKALIVEIDGGVHRDQKDQDRYRDFLCRKLGFEVVRFTNSEVMNDLDSVLEKLEKVLGKE